MVRMNDLRRTLIPIYAARNEAGLADRQQALQVLGETVKEDQDDFARIVKTVDPIGRVSVMGRRRPVAADGYLHGHDAASWQLRHGWPKPPVDEGGRQMEQQIDDARRRRDASCAGRNSVLRLFCTFGPMPLRVCASAKRGLRIAGRMSWPMFRKSRASESTRCTPGFAA